MGGLCWNCAQDEHLRAIIQEEGSPIACGECGLATNNTVDPGQLAEIIGPIIRDNFEIAVPRNGRDVGDALLDVIVTVLGRQLDCLQEIEAALVASDEPRTRSGGEPFFSSNESYVRSPVEYRAMTYKWKAIEQELKHQQRFFSQTAQTYFGHLFARIDEFRDGWSRPVVLVYPPNTELYRARALANLSGLDRICQSPGTELGPPPGELARAGRMNASGVSVFYGAFDLETCFAEMRPSLASHLPFEESVGSVAWAERRSGCARPLLFFICDLSIVTLIPIDNLSVGATGIDRDARGRLSGF